MKACLRLLELLTIYVVIPLLFYFKYIPIHKLVTLSLVFGYCLAVLLINRNFKRSSLSFIGFKGWVGLLLRVLIATLTILALTYIIIPSYLFVLPYDKPMYWVAVFFLYPIWSVIPQEFIYRSFFFNRYKLLFRNEKVMAIASATLFAFLHIVFHNWIAVACSFCIGLLWSFAYLRHRSLAAISVEHAIVGIILFTVGLGNIFFN
ncbi:CPBP family intramembrane glutamic endopeptidase [uncultured Acetobacteroides sp.]|uniref:CPBP family intramembrane glutamic endopeptidase n=1 Tax=uncultured Acetobacteroides sp. TaxID=1760811 RepID=UPI0029F57EC5|nr:CPBP family intramembrane glutamic endopeptidase [uncultured Acetobacteroides sp.]